MNAELDRRRFLQASGLLMGAASLSAAAAAPAVSEKQFRKALGWSMIQDKTAASEEDKFRLVKDVGFDGVEVSVNPGKRSYDPKQLARASQKTGVPIHGVSAGAHPDLKAAIDEAALYGADSVLHVVRTDPNLPLAELYRNGQEAIRAAIPQAEKKKVRILVENVWATFLIDPMTMARFVDELASPWVKAYFDVGNVMRWGWPQQWIGVLGPRIGKIHIKEYNLKVAMREGMLKGFDFPLGAGDIDWKRVCAELTRVGYRGWATAEVRGGDRQRLADLSAQMDRVLQ